MANFKIFQDNPDQAKVKIFGSNNAELNTDSSGNLTITSTGCERQVKMNKFR